MTDREQFARAMQAYDNADRHSEGILAVVQLIRSETKAAVEADVERYPLAERVKDQTRLRMMADENASRLRAERDQARADLQMAEIFLATLRARVDELDAKRS